jgi:sugar transferase (PEP-CTERM system associated)
MQLEPVEIGEAVDGGGLRKPRSVAVSFPKPARSLRIATRTAENAIAENAIVLPVPARRSGFKQAAGLVRRVLVFGAGEKALEAQRVLAESDCAVEIVGFLPSPKEQQARIPGNLILHTNKSLLDTALSLDVDEIVVAVSDRRGGVLPLRELLDCKLNGIPVFDLASHFEQRLGQIPLDSLNASWLIFGTGFRQDFLRKAVKRLFDVLCALGLFLLALPIMALTAVLIVWESGFPIFYRQERVGLNGRGFNVIKFRSMRTDAEKDGQPRWAAANDDRVTRLGRLIRKLRIDELPQLLSVLKGDMSLVGPRPERPFFVEQLTEEIPFYAVRHSLKPGVTGWAQVRYHYGACKEDSAKKLQYDLYYVKNHTLFLDLWILFRTINVVLTGKGAQ